MKTKSAVLFFVLLLLIMPSALSQDSNTNVSFGISAGNSHLMAINQDGSLWSWGANFCGQLGDGTKNNRSTPAFVLENVASIVACHANTMAVKRDGSLWVWGFNGYGQLGDGTMTDRATPVHIMDNVASVSTGLEHTMIRKQDGSLWGRGSNIFGQLGDGTTSKQLTPVYILDDVVSVSAGYFYTMAVKQDGSLWGWGDNSYGQLGDGTMNDRLVPTKIMDNVASVSTGEYHTMVIKKDGSLWGWGWNANGELGDGTTAARSTPVHILDDVAFVSVGERHTMAIKQDGSLWAWGNNEFGQLGDGTRTYRTTPIHILDYVASVSAGQCNTITVKQDGSLWAWGDNEFGQLGNGTQSDSLVPAQVLHSMGGGYFQMWEGSPEPNGSVQEYATQEKPLVTAAPVDMVDRMQAYLAKGYHKDILMFDPEYLKYGRDHFTDESMFAKIASDFALYGDFAQGAIHLDFMKSGKYLYDAICAVFGKSESILMQQRYEAILYDIFTSVMLENGQESYLHILTESTDILKKILNVGYEGWEAFPGLSDKDWGYKIETFQTALMEDPDMFERLFQTRPAGYGLSPTEWEAVDAYVQQAKELKEGLSAVGKAIKWAEMGVNAFNAAQSQAKLLSNYQVLLSQLAEGDPSNINLMNACKSVSAELSRIVYGTLAEKLINHESFGLLEDIIDTIVEFGFKKAAASLGLGDVIKPRGKAALAAIVLDLLVEHGTQTEKIYEQTLLLFALYDINTAMMYMSTTYMNNYFNNENVWTAEMLFNALELRIRANYYGVEAYNKWAKFHNDAWLMQWLYNTDMETFDIVNEHEKKELEQQYQRLREFAVGTFDSVSQETHGTSPAASLSIDDHQLGTVVDGVSESKDAQSAHILDINVTNPNLMVSEALRLSVTTNTFTQRVEMVNEFDGVLASTATPDKETDGEKIWSVQWTASETGNRQFKVKAFPVTQTGVSGYVDTKTLTVTVTAQEDYSLVIYSAKPLEERPLAGVPVDILITTSTAVEHVELSSMDGTYSYCYSPTIGRNTKEWVVSFVPYGSGRVEFTVFAWMDEQAAIEFFDLSVEEPSGPVGEPSEPVSIAKWKAMYFKQDTYVGFDNYRIAYDGFILTVQNNTDRYIKSLSITPTFRDIYNDIYLTSHHLVQTWEITRFFPLDADDKLKLGGRGIFAPEPKKSDYNDLLAPGEVCDICVSTWLHNVYPDEQPLEYITFSIDSIEYSNYTGP